MRRPEVVADLSCARKFSLWVEASTGLVRVRVDARHDYFLIGQDHDELMRRCLGPLDSENSHFPSGCNAHLEKLLSGLLIHSIKANGHLPK